MQTLILDCETMGKEGNLNPVLNTQEFTCGEILKENGVRFVYNSPNELVDKLIELIEAEKKRNGRTYIFGWNTQYDFYAIFRDYLKNSLIIQFPNGKMIKYFTFYPFMALYGVYEGERFKADAYFLDMMSFFRCPLKDLGEMIGMPKMEMPMNPSKIEDIYPYLHRDCEITMEGFKRMKGIINELGFRPKSYLTAGNVAIRCFLTYCKKNNISYIFSHKGKTYQGKHINEFRNAFRGGRFECFQTGLFKKCIKIDCNSMYGSMMITMDFPDLKNEYYTQNKEELMMAIKDKIGCIRCKVESPISLEYGYLPIRIGDMTYYPIGKEMEGTWTSLELKRALNLGYIIKELYEGIWFEKAKINPFSDYMMNLWNLRKNKKGLDREVIKLLMNSLFGKFSQYRTNEEIKIINRRELNEYKEQGFKFLKTAEDKYIIHKEGEPRLPRYANPMISTWITALGRNYLYDIMCKIPREDLIYVATDGLIFKLKNVIESYGINIGTEIGEFKIEEQGECKMLGENRYRFNNKIFLGGIPKKDVNIDVFEGRRKVKTSKMISIKNALNNDSLRDKIGTFKEEEIQISSNFKGEVKLPYKIVEKENRRFKNNKWER